MKAPAPLMMLARNGHLGRLLECAASAGFAALILAAGLSVLPRTEGDEEVRYYRTPAAADEPIPVFAMRPDRSVVRNAIATPGPDGVLRMTFFDGDAAGGFGATEPLLFDAGLTVLWMTASEESQDELRARFGALQDQGARSLEQVVTSRVFTEEYRPRLRAILTGAITTAWEAPLTQSALRALMERASPMVGQAVRTDIGDVLRPRFQQALWDMAAANWTNVGVLVGYDLDYMPLNEAVAATMRDPKLQESFGKLGAALLETPEARRLCERVVIATASALARDARLPGLAEEMVHDVRLHEQIHPASDVLMDVVRALPKHLGGLGSESNLNPLAAQVFKALALNRSGKVILFVSPQDRARILKLDPEAAVPLHALKPPAERRAT
ncbi:hypothetical protein [Azospirillum sp. SYSU D00513]|uniref:hypothetical protein n=1 Tax=Azospirillum sp. SYSU D00513 TaxID=2812561 RepID=UPI001A97299E|nr:hypothetical protein [Azospirillum sp. SYSU D00513]